MTSTPTPPNDDIFENFTLCLVSLVDTRDIDERGEIIGDAKQCIRDCGDEDTRRQMTIVLDLVRDGTLI